MLMENVLTSLGLALLFLVLGIPLMLGKVKRNGVCGARFPATLVDDRVWDVVNRKTGFLFVAGGAVAGIVDLLAVAGVVTRDVGLYVVGALVVYILIAAVWLWRYSEQVGGTLALLPVTWRSAGPHLSWSPSTALPLPGSCRRSPCPIRGLDFACLRRSPIRRVASGQP
jgi:hypothetical protein